MSTVYNNFDWSKLNRKDIFDHFYLLKDKIVEKELSQTSIYRIYKNHARKLGPVISKKIKSFNVDHGYIYIGGTYYPDKDEECQPSIELGFYFNPWDDKIRYSHKRFRRAGIILADTILHEIVHMRQYRRRNFSSRPNYISNASTEQKKTDQSYMGNYDEIDAYGFNIACELHSHFNTNISEITKYLNQTNKNAKKSFTWKWYLKTFDYDHNHPVIRKLKTKIIKYIPSAKLGKPYKNNSYLWY